MKKYSFIIIFILAFGAISAIISSCAKSSATSTRSLIPGKWKLGIVAVDSNADKFIESNEIRDTGLYSNYFATYNTNGSGFYTYNSATAYPFSWALSNHDSVLMITDSLYISTQSLYIDSVSSTTLSLYFTDTANRKVWNIYKRQ